MKDLLFTPKYNQPTFKKRMDMFFEMVPPALRYSEGAAYMIKDIICDGFPLARDTEILSVAFKEPDAVQYMHVCRKAYCVEDAHIAIIVKVTDTGWELIFSKFKYSQETNCQYFHFKNYGQPENLIDAFSDYRDTYLHEIEKREERQRWIDAHPDYDPEPCLKAFKPEQEHHGWLMRLLMKIIPE